MVPQNVDGRVLLICRQCGLESEKVPAEKYRITESRREKRKDILVVEEERKKAEEAERRYLLDLYGKEGYEGEE
jgi:DNA-directed RNA polymerase subunit M/transcription elongation factor TFIIS